MPAWSRSYGYLSKCVYFFADQTQCSFQVSLSSAKRVRINRKRGSDHHKWSTVTWCIGCLFQRESANRMHRNVYGRHDLSQLIERCRCRYAALAAQIAKVVAVIVHVVVTSEVFEPLGSCDRVRHCLV